MAAMLARSTSQPKKHVVEDNERVGNRLAGRPNASLVVVDLHHSGVLAPGQRYSGAKNNKVCLRKST